MATKTWTGATDTAWATSTNWSPVNAPAGGDDVIVGASTFAIAGSSPGTALASLTNRELRERIMQASLNRGGHGGDNDNRAIVAQTAKLRAERAALLGYKNHADYVLQDQTAGNIEAVNKLLGQLAPPAVANARTEAADIRKDMVGERSVGL